MANLPPQRGSRLTVRLISRLDIKGPNLVKGIHLEGLRVLGKPEAFARRYYEQGVDELIYLDAVASLYGRNSLLEIVERTAREIFIPLCVGGGLRTVDDIRRALRAGADKVALNSAALRRPELISEASRAFGSSTIVVQIDAIRRQGGGWEALMDGGRETSDADVETWAKRAIELGAGELLLTSVDQEGTAQGLDLDLIKRVSSASPVPVIACGGAGKPADVLAAISEGSADAVAVASLVHYEALSDEAFQKEAWGGEGNTEFLTGRRGTAPGRLERASIPAIKEHLVASGVPCRVDGFGP